MLKQFTRARAVGASAILGAAALGALAFSVPAAAAAGTQTSTSPSISYTCDFPIIGNQTVGISITATAPTSVTPGQVFSLTNVQSTSTISAAVTDDLAILESSLSGTVTVFDVNATHATPTTINGAATPISFGPIPFTAGQPLTLTLPPTPETVGTFTAGSSGTIAITPGDVTLTTTLNGTPETIPCTPPNSLPSGSAIDIPISSSSLPVSTIGGIGLAGVVGVGLVVRQRRGKSARAAGSSSAQVS